jgi:chemotaxis protein CheD
MTPSPQVRVERVDWRSELRADDRHVAIGELGLCAGGPPIVANRVGSTVVVAAHAPDVGLAGLAHVGLPSSRVSPTLAATSPRWFADSAVSELLSLFAMAGADKRLLRVVLIGGAGLIDGAPRWSVGTRTSAAALAALTRESVLPCRTWLGGSETRDVALTASGVLLIDGAVVEVPS